MIQCVETLGNSMKTLIGTKEYNLPSKHYKSGFLPGVLPM